VKNFRGVFTAIISPFKDDKIDFQSLEKLLNHQLQNGVDGFVVNGTTGESPTLKVAEREEMLKFFQDKAKGKTIIFGTGSNSTEKTITDSQRAEKLGADAVLVVVPYYNKPPQRGLVKHFTAVAKSISIPVILYNVPGRTVAGLNAESIAELSQVKNIIGIKEATGDIGFLKEIKSKVPNDFILLTGDDGTYVEFLKAGGHGAISVTSHVFPKAMKNWEKMVASGEAAKATEDFIRYKKLTDLMFVEANPIPVKATLKMMGLIASDELRLPLVSLEEKWQSPIKAELKNLHLLP
jgi:4-hydroxy-tetrahydrodipicolinate synthase